MTELYIYLCTLNGLIAINKYLLMGTFSYMDNVQRNLLWASVFATCLRHGIENQKIENQFISFYNFTSVFLREFLLVFLFSENTQGHLLSVKCTYNLEVHQ